MTASLRMKHLRQKISELETTYQSLHEIRSQEITKLIGAFQLSDIDNPTLIGALLFIKTQVDQNDPIKEDWFEAGEKFLRTQKRRPKKKTATIDKTLQKVKATNCKDSSTLSTGEKSNAKSL